MGSERENRLFICLQFEESYKRSTNASDFFLDFCILDAILRLEESMCFDKLSVETRASDQVTI
jgi:hypothetical protein